MRIRIRTVTGAVMLIAIFFTSCDNSESCTKTIQPSILDQVNAAQLAIDNAIIADYIQANSLGPAEEVNGIKYIIKTQGSGVTPCLENNVTVSYVGKFMSNGSVFDSNLSGANFPLSQLILGWQLTFPSFTKGTSATIFVPSGYGYGPQGSSRIPANANLIFDIDLTNVR